MEASMMLWENSVLACLTGISAVTDMVQGKVYNAVTVPAFLTGIVFSVYRAGASGILEILCAAVFTGMILYPFYRAGGLGAGDIKLLTAVAAFMPSETYLRCFAGAFVIGAVLGVIRLLRTGGRVHKVHFAVPVAASVFLHLAGMY